MALDAASWANITLATGTAALAAVTFVLAKRAKQTAESGLELERRFIERTDFPAARRGYERVEVDHHLRQVADWVEELKRAAPASDSSSVASAAAEQVRGIVDAAERSATEIRSKAEREAEGARRRADREASETRERAGSRPRPTCSESRRPPRSCSSAPVRSSPSSTGSSENCRARSGAWWRRSATARVRSPPASSR